MNTRRLMLLGFVGLLLGALVEPGVSDAATPTGQVQLSWPAVTQLTDNTAIPTTSPVTYYVYSAPAVSGPWTYLQVSSGTSVTRTAVPVGPICYEISAVVNTLEGAPSAPVCLTVVASVTPQGVGTVTVKQVH